MAYGPKEPTAATAEANRAALARYAMDDVGDFDDIDRGLVAKIDKTLTPQGDLVFDFATLDDVTPDKERPDSVNPSLWRQSQLNSRGGLFKVTDGLYQSRGSGTANLTIVDGPDGLVIIDCTASTDSAAQGLQLFREHVSDKPVAAVIYTHTHFDHYGGVKGVVDAEDVASGKVPILAPGTTASFDKFALGENIITGSAMSRRAGYTFATMLAHGPCEMVTGGISPRWRPASEHHLHLPDRPDHRDRDDPAPGWVAVRVPLCPGHRSAGRDAHLDPRAEGPDLRGERQPHHAQHPDPARRAHP